MTHSEERAHTRSSFLTPMGNFAKLRQRKAFSVASEGNGYGI